ncbi:MAG: class I SAM-dependent methyltransferase [Thermoanaerobaculia bacterium]
MSRRDVAVRIARRFDSRFLRGYVVAKLIIDPMYEAVLARVAGSPAPIVDVGCGIGLVGLFLREHGVGVPVTGVDFDRRKVEAGRKAVAQYPDVELRVGDARDPLPRTGTVLLLDVLHYFSGDEQRAILRNAAVAADAVIVRDAIRDSSWRYRATALTETFARAVFWLKAERLNFLSLEEIAESFVGFEVETIPMYGRTPFNNYMLVFRRESSGTTNA